MILGASDIASAARWSAIWEACEYASEGLVLLGCAGEYIAEYTKWRTEVARHSLGRRSLIILILGLGSGLFSLIKTNALAGVIIASLGEQVEHAGEKAERVAGSLDAALSKTNQALSTSSDAVSNSIKAQKSASDALGTARAAREEADTFEQDIKTARKEASDALANLADAKRLAEEAQSGTVRNTEKLADRHLTPEQQQRIRDKLRKFPPVVWGIVTYSNDGEAIGLAGDLKSALTGAGGAGWRDAPMISITTSKPDVGVLIEYTPGSVFAVHEIALALVSALRAERLEEIGAPKEYAPNSGTAMSMGSFTNIRPNEIIVTIARKP